MTIFPRPLRAALISLTLVGILAAGTSWIVPSVAVMAGSSGQPGDIDVGSTPTTHQLAGSSGQPGDIDVGSTPTTHQLAGSSGQPGDIDVG